MSKNKSHLPKMFGNLTLNDVQTQINKSLLLLQSDDPNQNLEGAVEIRKLLSIEQNPPIDEVLNAGVLPYLVRALRTEDMPTLHFEAIWAITNIASGTSAHTLEVIKAGAISLFVHLLDSESVDVREQTIWAFGNIAGDSPQSRDMVLQLGVTPTLCNLGYKETKVSLQRNLVWTISNLCRGKPAPDYDVVKEFVTPLSKWIQSSDDEVVTDSMWALSYLSDGENRKIQAIIDSGCIPTIVKHMSSSNMSILTPALRTIGNVVTGDDYQTEVVLQSGFLQSLTSLLTHSKKSIRKEAFWTLSNITAGNVQQIEYCINSGIMDRCIQLLSKEKDPDCIKEGCWALSNATSGGSYKQLQYLVGLGLIKLWGVFLDVKEPRLLAVVLESIKNLLTGDKEGEFKNQIEDFVDKIEELQNHPNMEIYELCQQILTAHFEIEDGEEEDPEEMVKPSNNNFQF
jgi:importin subunit alpha-1